MTKSPLFEKGVILKEKFANFFQHKKKIRALDNYALCAPFQDKDYLSLIRKCLSEAFLHPKEADFLDHLLGKYKLLYLDWAHKTRWLHKEMDKLRNARKRAPEPQICFDFAKRLNTPIHIPVEVLMPQKASRAMRRI